MQLALLGFDDRLSFGHLALLGIVVQTTSAALLAAVFHTIRRHSRGRAYVREWSAAWIALTVAIAAVFMRYVTAESWDSPRFVQYHWTRAELAVPVLDSIYQFGKFLFFGLLLSGSIAFARSAAAPRRPWMALVALAVAIATVLISGSLNDVVVWQGPVAVVATTAAAFVLLRLRGDRANFGTRALGGVLLVYAIVWAAYCWSFFIRDDATASVPELLTTLRTYNSFIDVLLQTTLALAMIITIFLDLEREAEVARHERQRMQERLAQSQKLEALGGVVSGVAHELNNPLTAILGFSEEMRRLHPEGDTAECARVVHEQAERCRAIVRDLLTFARSRTAERVAVDTSELIARVVRGFDPEMRRRALDFELESDANLPPLLAEPAALEQVFANLIANAIHASPDGGRIRVSARPAGRSVEFWIEDEGPGVPRELRDRIFEPFFTTKAPGQGTGLGLSVTHGIVATHGGTIRCDDRADGRSGARFVVALPVEGPDAKSKTKRLSRSDLAAACSAPAAPDAPSPAESVTSAGKPPLRVLVADDEEAVRRLLVRRVKQRGFEVFEAASGRTALQQIADHPDLDAIVSDLKMPDTSGFELLEWLATHLPGLLERTIVISGDVQSQAVTKVVKRFRCAIFEKPLDLDAVVAKIESLAGLRAPAPAQPTRIA